MVSVIISFYERTEHLFRCLDALELNHDHFDEVVIADDGSNPETVEKVKAVLGRYSFPVKYVWRDSQRFEVAAARNHGIRAASGSYLIFFDCDFLIMPDAVQKHVQLRKKGRFVVGDCKYLSSENSTDLFTKENLTLEYLESLYQRECNYRLRKLNFRYHRRNLMMRLRLASYRKQRLGGHMSVFREDIERVNGYDENFIGWGGEDEDIGRRLTRAGIYCIPALTQVRVMHMWHQSELNGKHWKQGSNIAYHRRINIPFRCSNGLVKEFS